LKGHTGGLLAVAASPDGSRIVTGATDNTARIWDGVSGKELFVLTGHTGDVSSVAVSPDSATVVTGSDDKTVRLWDAKTGQQIGRFSGHTRAVTSIAILPDGSRVVSAGLDGTVRIWDIKTGVEIARITGEAERFINLALFPASPRLVTFWPGDGLSIWDLRTGTRLVHFDSVSTYQGWSLAVSKNGTRIAVGFYDGSAAVLDAGTGSELTKLTGHTEDVATIKFSDDSALVATGSSDNTIRIWDAKSGKERERLGGHESGVKALAFLPGKYSVVSASADRTARIWRRNAEVQRNFPTDDYWIDQLAATPSVDRIFTSSNDDSLRIWNVGSRREISRLTGAGVVMMCLAISPDGSKVAAGYEEGVVRVWDAATNAQVFKLNGHTEDVRALAMLPGGKRLVTGSNDNTAIVWDLVTGAEVYRLEGHLDDITSLAVTPDGERIITGSDDDTAMIWDARNGSERLQLNGHTDSVVALAVTPDGTRVITGSRDGTARVWDVKTGDLLREIQTGEDYVLSLAITQDGKRLVVGVKNGLSIRDLATGVEQARIVRDKAYFSRLLAMPDGQHTLTNGGGKVENLFELLPVGAALIEATKAAAPRCLTLAQRERFHLAVQQPGWCIKQQHWPVDTNTVATQILDAIQDSNNHLDSNRPSEALRGYEKVIALEPDRAKELAPKIATAHNDIAWDAYVRFLKTGNKSAGFKSAMREVEEAISLAPDDLGILDTRGELRLVLGQVDEAFADLDKVLRSGLVSPIPLVGRGRIYELKGNLPAAIADFRDAVVLDASDDEFALTVQSYARERLAALGASLPSSNERH
jgi:eukaryotic-like serine/threonine-protein kinase